MDFDGSPVLTEPVVMLDFETTGLSPALGARITEVAALRIVDGRVVERFVSLVNCGVRIPYEITMLTGISQHMVDRAPPVQEVVPALLRFIGRDALSAHNASFDAKFLAAESAMLGMRPAYSALLCSLLLARRLLPGRSSYKLSNLAAALNIRFSGNAHRAEADAEVSAQLLIHLADHLRTRHRCAVVDSALLTAISKVTAAKVPAFLLKQVALASA